MANAVLELREPLEQLGFRKRAGQVYTTDLTDDVIGWVGLNKASKHRQPGQVEVNPVVGVRNQQVERLVAELLGGKFHDYVPPTVSTPIGYVMPGHKYTSWVIGEGASPSAVEDLVTALADHAVPFMQSLVKLPELRQTIEKRMGHQLEYRLPVVLALMGQPAEAHDVLEQAVRQLGTRQDAAAERLRRFAEAFRRHQALTP